MHRSTAAGSTGHGLTNMSGYEVQQRWQPVQPEWEVRRRVKFGSESVCLCWFREDAERIARMLRSSKNSLCEKEKR